MVEKNGLWEKNNCYQNGHYYEDLLPEYSWDGLSDTAYLDYYLSLYLKRNHHSILELAAGTGRATKIIEPYSVLVDAIEPNKDMLASFRPTLLSTNLVNEDMNLFLRRSSLDKYDTLFSFWGPYPTPESTKLLLEKVHPGTKGIFFHAHRGCYEQRLVRTILHLFKDASYNPNRDTSDKEDAFHGLLSDYERTGNLTFSVEGIVGNVQYRSFDFALESFLNFHFGSIFEKETYFKVHSSLQERLKEHLQPSGEVRLETGMKIFNFVKC